METFHSNQDLQRRPPRAAVAIGNFDGVHLGHQALFRRARQLAAPQGSLTVALTFSPHPARFFNAELAPPLIDTERQKLAKIARCGVDLTVVEHFDGAMAALPPEAFVQRILVDQLRASHIVVGDSFVFGHQRAGNLQRLHELGQQHGYQTDGLSAVRADGLVVSSSKIREFVMLGRAGGAAKLLGQPFSVEGTVVTGAGRGRQIGIPTANLAPENELLPGRGVYAGRVRIDDGVPRSAVVNIGRAPTFDRGNGLTLEAHLLDFSGNLVGRRIEVAFLERLRDERRFSSVGALVEAIQADIRQARRLLC